MLAGVEGAAGAAGGRDLLGAATATAAPLAEADALRLLLLSRLPWLWLRSASATAAAAGDVDGGEPGNDAMPGKSPNSALTVGDTALGPFRLDMAGRGRLGDGGLASTMISSMAAAASATAAAEEAREAWIRVVLGAAAACDAVEQSGQCQSPLGTLAKGGSKQ